MEAYFAKHRWYVSSLIVVFGLSAFLISQLSYSKQIQVAIVIGIGVFYETRGILHHHLHHEIHTKIVIEYILIGSLGMTIALFFLKGGIF